MATEYIIKAVNNGYILVEKGFEDDPDNWYVFSQIGRLGKHIQAQEKKNRGELLTASGYATVKPS